jgi:hypothetical protein
MTGRNHMESRRQQLACSLEGAELVERIEAWREVVSSATGHDIHYGRVVTTYPKDGWLVERLRELIEAEAECCSFLEFTVDERPDSIVTELRLAEETPASMRTLILGLFGGCVSPAARPV